jgi:hypothetical protein
LWKHGCFFHSHKREKDRAIFTQITPEKCSGQAEKEIFGLSDFLKKTVAIPVQQWYYNKARLRRYALKREVAADTCRLFPWSMSDFKPGDKYF